MITTIMLFLATAQPAQDSQWALRTTMDALGKVTRQESLYKSAAQCEQAKRLMIWAMDPPVRGHGGTYRARCVAVRR